MENLSVPVAPKRVGRIEWVSLRDGSLYGVDGVGRVFRLRPEEVTGTDAAAVRLARVLAGFGGLGRRSYTPRRHRATFRKVYAL